MGTPESVQNIRKFNQTDPASAMLYLMETNDVFIISAVLVGIIDRVIWVKPSWVMGKSNASHLLEIGTYRKGNIEIYCMCIKVVTETKKKSCFYLDRDREGSSVVKIAQKDCVVVKRIVYIEINENKFLHLSRKDTREWGNNFLLDIDEDYFGVDSDVARLLEAGVGLKYIDAINYQLHNLYCPVTVKVEQLTNEQVSEAIVTMIGAKLHDFAKETIIKLVSSSLLRNSSKINFCDSGDLLKHANTASKLVTTLSELTVRQLSVVLRTKFCLQSSPILQHRPTFILCHGKLFPWETKTMYYRANHTNVIHRAGKLENFMEKLGELDIKFQIITMARSIRDGYTPRSTFQLIERTLITMLHRSLAKHGIGVEEEYDGNLLFGRSGWVEI